jgi:Flp pilus assembly protein TadB
VTGAGTLGLAAASLAALGAGTLGWVLARHLLPLLSGKAAGGDPKRIGNSPLSGPNLVRGLFFLSLPLVTILLGCFWGGCAFFIALLGIYCHKKGPTLLKKWTYGKKRALLSEVFPQTLGMAAQALKTGQTLPQVLDYLSRECPSPMREELKLVCSEIDLGSSVEQALNKMAERYPDFREMNGFLESYRISRQTGANLARLWEVQLEGLEEKNRILRKIDAMTAQARLSAWMIGFLPLVLGSVFFFLDPNMILPLFTQKAGWGILGLAVGLETVGFYWLHQLMRLEV